jgi:hypothetical protein
MDKGTEASIRNQLCRMREVGRRLMRWLKRDGGLGPGLGWIGHLIGRKRWKNQLEI